METNRSWSIDDRRLNFQFGTEVGREIRDGKLGRLLRNPTYAGVTPTVLAFARRGGERAGMAVCGACSTAARASPARPPTSLTARAPARFRDVEVGVLR